MPSAKHEQHVPEWDEWVPAKDPTTGALLFRTVQTAAGPVQEQVMDLHQGVLDVAFDDDDGTRAAPAASCRRRLRAQL